MSQFLESICAINGKILNLEYHQNRVDKTFNKYFKNSNSFMLTELLSGYEIPSKKSKIKMVYSENKYEISVNEYIEKKIEKVKVVIDNDIDYSFKSANRDEINKHVNSNAEYDDVIIVKENLVTDSSYANLLFFNGDSWFTPKKPLLYGTKRARLINKKLIKEKDIAIDDINKFSYFMQINAMLDFDIKRKISIKNICF